MTAEPRDVEGRCGFTIIGRDGWEQPCERPATGWRWYQDHDHEDTLDVACDRHENEGGRRLAAADRENAELRGEVERLEARSVRADEARRRIKRARDAAYAKVGRVELLHVWTNEDGRRFVFADDLAKALGLPL